METSKRMRHFLVSSLVLPLCEVRLHQWKAAGFANPALSESLRARRRLVRVKIGVLAVVAVVVATGCGSTTTVTKTVTVTTAATAKIGVGPPGEQVEFGYIKSLTPKGNAFELKFDPAWLLSGKTANQAALEDTGSSDVPNDNYVVNEGHRLLTYIVPANARITALTKGVTGTPITVAQLSGIVSGKNPLGHPLWEGINTGFWIRVNIDTVRSLDQQYRP